MMKTWRWMGLLAIAAIGVVACGGDADPTGDWTLTEMDGAFPLAGTEITATFTDGTVGGFAGCNNYTTSYEIDGSEIAFNPNMPATLAACDIPIMDQEQMYLALLVASKELEVADGELHLIDAGGSVVLRFE